MKSITERLQRDITYEGGSYPEPNEWKVSKEITGDMEEEIAKVENLCDKHNGILHQVSDNISYRTYLLLMNNIKELAMVAIAAIKTKYE